MLASPLAGRDGSVYMRAGILLAIGVALWTVDRVARGPAPEIDEEHIGQA